MHWKIFFNFNKEITIKHGSCNFAIVLNTSYISKSGKRIPWFDKFRSGVAGAAKFGLEISGIAAVDIDNETTFHLEAVQTPTYKEISPKSMTLLDWYADVIIQRKNYLTSISNYFVSDAVLLNNLL